MTVTREFRAARRFHPWGLRAAATAILLAGVATPAFATSAAQAQPVDDPNQEILVLGQRFRTVQLERSFDEDAVKSFGVSTIDELLGNIDSDLGSAGDRPMILVNGKRINDLSEIGALPVEVLKGVEVLPRGYAIRAGGTSGQRVINLTLKRETRSATLTAAHKIATEGDWNAERGEAILTRVKGDTRANLTLRAGRETSLLESDRDILQPASLFPFALGGNIIAYPLNIANEIDPLLSLAAGRTVTIAAVPAGTHPTLADFAANANGPATTDLGHFRTLRPAAHSFDLNATYATRLTPWLTSSATLRIGRNRERALRGLPSGLFRIPSNNPQSPFSRDVVLTEYGVDPLHSSSSRSRSEASWTLNGDFGRWTGNAFAQHSVVSNNSDYQRQTSSSTIQIGNDVNPFGGTLSPLIATTYDHFRSRSQTDQLQSSMTGPAFNLPAGPLTATVEGRIARNRLRSQTTTLVPGERITRRSEQGVRAALDIPLASRDAKVMPQIGDLSATLEVARNHYSDAGGARNASAGLNWQPTKAFQVHASVERLETPPAVQILGDPVISTPNVRVFDPLTGQTVDVTQITGGNANLRSETDITRRLSGIVTMWRQINLQLNAEYTDTNRRNLVSALPDASAAVMLAFPDRYVRRPGGALTQIDLRPVNFAAEREKQLRWGLSMSTRLGASKPGSSSPSTNLQLSVNHNIVFSDRIFIRPGLDPIDLIGGGAIGIGGGRLRHQIDGSGALTSGGLGIRAAVAWRGPSTLLSRSGGVTDTLHFSSLVLINIRSFADVKRFMPRSEWANGLRISLDAINLTNHRQRVSDRFGTTPLQYQRGYRDPLGRTIELELRKVF